LFESNYAENPLASEYLIVPETNLKSSKMIEGNYFEVFYTTGTGKNYSEIYLVWNCNCKVQEYKESIEFFFVIILTFFITTVLICCAGLGRKLYYYLTGNLETPEPPRIRNYRVIPEDSFLQSFQVDRLFPAKYFQKHLLEVGESTCCICFEE